MTKYFEVTRRDAAARLGRLMLQGYHSTPLILKAEEENPIIYAGSLWDRGTLSPLNVEPGKLVILPDKSMPLHARPESVREMIESGKEAREVWEDWGGPIGRIIHPAYPDISQADIYAIGAARQLENNPGALLNIVIRIKNNILPDTALYAPALATPENIAMLIYLGIDIVDDILPTIRAFHGTYMMQDGEYRVLHLKELPCTCKICENTNVETLTAMDAHSRSELLAQHNRNRLEEEKRIAVQHIRDGNLREYVEGKCRSNPGLTALLRLMDREHSYLEQQTPAFRSGTMYTNSSESLSRVEITRFAGRVKSRYQSPDAGILLLLPCSARKPYSMSNSHQMFDLAIGKYKRMLNELIITSPLGVVPRELELVYPAAHYDTPVTGHWDLEERSWVGGCLKDYLKAHGYQHIIGHVDGAYRDICMSAADELDIEINFTAEGSVTSVHSLDSLRNTVRNVVEEGQYLPRKPAQIKKDMLRAIADYQYAKGAGYLLVSENATIQAPYPKHQVYEGKKQLAGLNPRTGALALTIEGAQRLVDLGVYQVHIDDFVPRGNLLAPGVLEADFEIRPSDQVIVIGEKVLGVGRAMMSGWEMVRSTRGVAVKLRKVMEI